MKDVGRHPNITLHTLSEVREVQGYVGNFTARIFKKARFVEEKDCSGCGDCAEVCPVVRPDEFNLGLSSRRAIYMPFPQAVPASYTINIEECLGHSPQVCAKCQEACEKKCIDFDMSNEEIEVEVGTIIVATGLDVYDPRPMDEYGYTRYENVLTSLEFERLVNAGGPTQGKLVRPTDMRVPDSVAFIQCVGSRSERRGNPYCSNICCMNTVKSTLTLKEHYPDIEVKVFYIDIRAFGKGFEDLYRRSRMAGVRYIRGLPGDVSETDGERLLLKVENTATNTLETHTADMVVLAVGLEPRRENSRLKEALALQCTSDGFYLEAHPKLQPVDSASKGIFFAGAAEGPKDIKESVTQASAAASRAVRLMNRGEITIEGVRCEVVPEHCNSCGRCADVCPYNAVIVDTKKKTPAQIVEAACAGCGTCAAECRFGAIVMHHYTDEQIRAQIDTMLASRPQDKIPAFACNWCSYAGADYAGVSRLQYPPSARLIRTMCSGRVSEDFIWHAFRRGAPVVLVSGCHIGDCHYIDANHWTEKRIARMHTKMARRDIRPDRLQLAWISAAEGVSFQKWMQDLDLLRQTVTSEEIAHTKAVLKKRRAKKKER